MHLAYHAIFSMYGFWLPNDPRGSGSDYIAMWKLFRCGNATKTDSRQSVAHVSHDQQLRFAAKKALHYPPVDITGRQAVSMVAGFRVACDEAGYRIHACSVLPDHVHLVIGAHSRDIRQIVGHLKSKATRNLNLRPMARRWAAGVGRTWLEHLS